MAGLWSKHAGLYRERNVDNPHDVCIMEFQNHEPPKGQMTLWGATTLELHD